MRQNFESVSTDELLRLLADPQRRAVLRYLRDREDATASVAELAAALAAVDEPLRRSPREEEATGGAKADEGRLDRSATGDGRSERSAEVDRHLAKIHHAHLPKLAHAGIVEYDQRNGTVRYHQHETVEGLLAYVAEHVE